MSNNELLNCPFCGSEAAKVKGVGFKVHGIVCTKCPCEVVWFSSEQEAVNLWNQRAERTCKFVAVNEVETVSDAWCEKQCSCGEWIDVTHKGRPNYCQKCGAKVVE